jgi:pseudaminic acid biosynthesis-associated methylase
MPQASQQARVWSGEFGRRYTDRNLRSVEEMDRVFAGHIGVPRTELNRRFVGGLDRGIRILEVGCNVGVQLMALQAMGFCDLWGLELQWYAVEKARERTRGINIVQGSALELPFRDGWFDLVYTSGVLIHVSPQDLPRVQAEIARCSRRWVWGYECHAPEMTEVSYRGNSELMWKADYPALYQEADPSLRVAKQELFRFQDTDMHDCMFLLEKAGA